MKWFAGLTLIFAFACPALSQSPLKAEVAISSYERGVLKTRTQTVQVPMTPDGKFSVTDSESGALRFLACGPLPSSAQLGTKVDGTVSATPDRRYEVRLVVSIRAAAGCRDVGAITVPIFANRIIEKKDVVIHGEVLSVPMGSSNGSDGLKVEVMLAPEG